MKSVNIWFHNRSSHKIMCIFNWDYFFSYLTDFSYWYFLLKIVFRKLLDTVRTG